MTTTLLNCKIFTEQWKHMLIESLTAFSDPFVVFDKARAAKHLPVYFIVPSSATISAE